MSIFNTGEPSGMSSRERVQAAIAREEVDRPPISLWQHFPNMDQTASDLSAATLVWQEKLRLDFVKFMVPGDYSAIDWGLKSQFQGSESGTRTPTYVPVRSVDDWRTIGPLNVRHGFHGRILEAVRRTRGDLGPVIYFFQTIFSPLTTAMKLSNGRVIEHLRARPDIVHEALTTIASVTAEMVHASFAYGADAIFFATQCADFDLMDEVEYREFGLHYDTVVLERVDGRGPILLHLHGRAPMFDLAAHYPVQIVNWHDRRAAPHLVEGQRLWGGCVAGGIDELAIVNLAPEQVTAHVRDAIDQTGGRGLIIAPGCVLPTTTPVLNIAAAVEATWGQPLV